MTSSIPDGLSFAQLQELMADAKKPDEPKQERISEEEIAKLIIPAVMAIRKEIGDVSAYKNIAMFCLFKLFEFHNDVALEQMNDKDADNDIALCWARDAGWLQTTMNTLRGVCCGPNDHFTEFEEEDDND